jgi:nicotinate-nucleotide adenylyltransferase
MDKPTVAILGGAFDPIHLGHREVADQIIKSGSADRVWMMPAYGHMYDKKMASPEHRLAMVQRATQDSPRIQPFNYEIRNRLNGSTYDFFNKLLAEPFAKNYNFRMAIGQDNADTFHKWKNAEQLKQMVPFTVMARDGSPAPDTNAWYLQAPHQYISFSPKYKTSSTKVKQMLSEGHPMVPAMFHPDVLSYIHENGLYQR